MNNDAWLLLGALTGTGIPLALFWLWQMFTHKIYPNQTLLVLRFGKITERIDTPGLHFLLDSPAPWVRTVKVSRRVQAALLHDIEVHDVAGTELRVDMFIEYRIVDPVKATFVIEDLPGAVENLIAHAVITVLGGRPFTEILRDVGSLGAAIQAETRAETAAWGVEVSKVLLRQIRPSSMTIEQLLAEIAARLEKVKARIEEDGRQAVALLHATTAAEVAARIAEAQGQYLRAVGSAYAAMRAEPSVYQEYRELHALVLLRPAHTIAFRGFETGEIRASDAALFDMSPRAAE